jgi:hypothetical protein
MFLQAAASKVRQEWEMYGWRLLTDWNTYEAARVVANNVPFEVRHYSHWVASVPDQTPDM